MRILSTTRTVFSPQKFMVPLRCRFALSASVALAAMMLLPSNLTGDLAAETSPSGTISKDTVWSGKITIKADVRITGANVRVEPGATIHLIAPRAATFGPRIHLDSPSLVADRKSSSARLVLAGTKEHPIIVETPPNVPPGAIVSGAATRGSIVARHTIFRRLGLPLSDRRANHTIGLQFPAVGLQLTAPDNDLWLSDCRFEQCGPVRGEFLGPGASAHIERCTFANSIGRIALALSGAGSGVKVVTDNIADAGFHVECPQVLLRNNVLIGDFASISVPTPNATAISILNNYAHCTTREDRGRYVLKCEAPNAIVARNVLIGGTYVIETAPRTVTANVLVGVADLRARFDARYSNARLADSATTTHYLITNPVPHAVITDNYLVGPTYAAIATSRGSGPIRIDHNFFDGWGTARRGIHFNTLGATSTRATLNRNVFTRYQWSPIYDEANHPETVVEADHNLFADIGESAYEQISAIRRLAPGDRRVDTFSQLRLDGSASTQPAKQLEEQLVRREIDVSSARERWLAPYRPLADSPLAANEPAWIGPRHHTGQEPADP